MEQQLIPCNNQVHWFCKSKLQFLKFNYISSISKKLYKQVLLKIHRMNLKSNSYNSKVTLQAISLEQVQAKFSIFKHLLMDLEWFLQTKISWASNFKTEDKKQHPAKTLINFKWMGKYKQITCNNFTIWTWIKQATKNKEHKYSIINNKMEF